MSEPRKTAREIAAELRAKYFVSLGVSHLGNISDEINQIVSAIDADRELLKGIVMGLNDNSVKEYILAAINRIMGE